MLNNNFLFNVSSHFYSNCLHFHYSKGGGGSGDGGIMNLSKIFFTLFEMPPVLLRITLMERAVRGNFAEWLELWNFPALTFGWFAT